MRRIFRIIPCVLGVVLILFGLYQILSPSHQFNKEQYNECMDIYESAKLNMQTSMFYDIRQNYADIASDMHSLALDYQDKIDQSNVICIVSCSFGAVALIAGLFLLKTSKPKTEDT